MEPHDSGLNDVSSSWTTGQRRLRHLVKCLVRNISSEATAASPIQQTRPALPRLTSADDLDLELRRKVPKRKISLSAATRDRQSSVSTPLATPSRLSWDTEHRPTLRARTASSLSARSTSQPATHGEEDEAEMLAPLPRARRERATSRASVMSQGSIATMREAEPAHQQAQSQPQPRCCLTLSLPPTEGKGKAPACFYASDVVVSRNPTFEIDPESFHGSDDLLLRQSHFLSELWVMEADASEWKLHLQWDVDMTGLASLGHELPASLPSNANSLVFGLANGELLTASKSSGIQLNGHDHLCKGNSPLLDGEEEDEGSLSDPGTSQALAKARSIRALEATRRQELERRKQAIEISKRETRMLPSIGVGGIVRLLTLQTCIDDLRAETKESLTRLAKTVDDPGGLPHLKRQRGAAEARLRAREADLKTSSETAGERQETIRHRKEELSARRQRLRDAKDALDSEKDALGQLDFAVDGQISEHGKLEERIAALRSTRISELDAIFPIRPKGDDWLFSIVDLPLPNSVFDGVDDDQASSALGLTAQLVSLMSHYLGIALPYALTCRGSRSLVSDQITGGIRGPRAFPLYSKGVDHYRFDYAVFLLNKDIEHLLTLHRPQLAVLDLKQTLPNLYNLVLTATSGRKSADNGSNDGVHLAPAAPVPSSSSDTTTEDGTTDDEEETRAPSIRSTASGKTLRPGQSRANSEEKRMGLAVEKLKSLASAAVIHARTPVE